MENTEHLEMTVRRRDPAMQAKDNFRYHLFLALAAVFLPLALITLFVAISGFLAASGGAERYAVFLPPIVCLAIAAVCFFVKDNMRVEYDYSVEDGHLIVAKIRNLSSRKEVLDLPLNQLKRLEPFSPERFAALPERKLDFTLNENEAKHILFFTLDGTPTAAVMELNEIFQKALRKLV